MSKFNELIGKTLESIDGLEKGSDKITFLTNEGIKYFMSHDQDCCESVSVEDIHGEMEAILKSPITNAEVVTNSEDDPNDIDEKQDDAESFTWTYYYISTEKGSATIRWFGESNGYYSESVDFYREGTNSWD